MFHRAVIEIVLTFSLIVWFGSSTAQQRSQINNITRVASKIIGYDLPTIDEIYVSRLQKKGLKILKDPLHPARHLFTLFPSGRRLRAIKTKSTRFLNSTYCRIVHALNSSGVMPLYFTPYNWWDIYSRVCIYVYVCILMFVIYCWWAHQSKFQTTRVFGNK